MAMTRKQLMPLLTFAFGAIIGHVALPTTRLPFAKQQVVMAQTVNPIKIDRYYTGTDNQTHVEEMEAPFTGDVFKMLPVAGAELHRSSPGSVMDWHTAPRPQYVITLSGHGEIEVAGGKKISVSPGQIQLMEDITGKGHISRVTGAEDRVMLWLPIADKTASK